MSYTVTVTETETLMTTAQEVAQTTPADRPNAPVRTESFRLSRPLIVGKDVPESPFPIYLSGSVERGFGRGGKDLGCLTANLPESSLEPMTSVTQTGIYYGYARITSSVWDRKTRPEDFEIQPMVMSLGWNPFYKNEKLTAEVHIMHDYQSDFYGEEMSIVVLGYIRPELDYTSREALIDDINTDKRVALNSLARPAYEKFTNEEW